MKISVVKIIFEMVIKVMLCGSRNVEARSEKGLDKQ